MTYLNNKKFFHNDEADFAWQIGYTNGNKVNANKPKPSIYDNIKLEQSSGKKLLSRSIMPNYDDFEDIYDTNIYSNKKNKNNNNTNNNRKLEPIEQLYQKAKNIYEKSITK